MTTFVEIHEGESLKLLHARPNLADETQILDTGWVCKIKVLNRVYIEVIPVESVTLQTADNLHFVVSLTPIQTSLLKATKGLFTDDPIPTVYTLVIEMSNVNTVPPYSREKHIMIYVSRPGMA